MVSDDSSANVRITSTGSLLINKVDISLKGKYTCEADNGVGDKLTKSISISVRGNKLTVLDFKKACAKWSYIFSFLLLHDYALSKYLKYSEIITTCILSVNFYF